MEYRSGILITTLVGIVCVVAVIVLCILNPVIHGIIDAQVQLKPGSPAFQQWTEPTVPIFLQFYFFNLTNPIKFLSGAKPRLQQVGPFTYREHRYKRDVDVNQTASTIKYNDIKEYIFVRNLSVGPESEMVVNVNPVYVAVANQISSLPSFAVRIIEMAEKHFGDQLIMQRNVSDWLWGYEDLFLNFLKSHFIPVNITRIGLYVGRNNTVDGPIVIDSGTNSRAGLGHILSYHGSPSLSCWTTHSANQINGSDGSVFPPFVRSGEPIDVFAAEICRSIRFTPRGTVFVHGVSGIQYLPLEDTFDSPKENPRNFGFCPRWPTCFETGALDMATCQPGGAPIAVSMPHFTLASRTYQDAVDGLHPSAEFNTTFYIEPMTGVVLHAAKKIQVNINVTQNDKLRQLSKVSTVLLPIIFVNESATLDVQLANQLRYSVVLIPLAVRIGMSVVTFFSLLILAAIGCVFIHSRWQRRHLASPSDHQETEPLLNGHSATLVV
ncbi:Lysosome membrane protein 2 (Lysosome membrane protein II) [Paragonimus heterotremus]|uniref:Lysosome membrane protein 2 (Lysosome membrane protein II) n=1 Tax=Paragonimus heterotremus TaxID=100268 RepID=A0A8J4SWF0_9TREM|nr:Lysosome membrane protein 2 (Lysosome membrane protein II) [Paragonimus heterotremus]